MITFVRNATKVIVQIRPDIIPSQGYFMLELNQTYEYQAELLKTHLQQKLSAELERIRQESYEQGWKDAMRRGAPAKARRRKYFYGGWK